MDFDEFGKSIRKVSEKRRITITNSVGVKEIYRTCRREKRFSDKNKVTEDEFYDIIKAVNTLFAKELLRGREAKFPFKMGKLELRKMPRSVKIVDGKLVIRKGIDWNSTLRLWFDDEEAKENKTLVRVDDKFKFFVYYNRVGTVHKNRSMFYFKPIRTLAVAVNKAGNQGKIDAYTLGQW